MLLMYPLWFKQLIILLTFIKLPNDVANVISDKKQIVEELKG